MMNSVSEVGIEKVKIKKNTKPKSILLKNLKRDTWLYIFLIPGMATFIIFHYMAMYGIIIAFKDFSLFKGIWGSPWIGLENFQYLFQSRDFFMIFKNSLWISILRLIWGFPAPLLLALMINEMRNQLYKKTIQTVLYLPHFISWVVISGMVISFLSPTSGAINILIKSMGGVPISFLGDPKYFRSILIASEIWKEAGWGTIIYLAAMAGLDLDIYEAATIDGASRLQRIRYITVPGIMGTVIVLLILRTGSLLKNGFEQIYMLYSPSVYEVADVFETYTYRVGIMEGRFSFATAVGLFTSVVGFILIMSTNKLSKKIQGGGLW